MPTVFPFPTEVPVPEDQDSPGSGFPSPVDYGPMGPAGIDGLIREMLMRSRSGRTDPFMSVGSPRDVANVNPFTNSLFRQFQGGMSNALSQAFGTGLGNTPQEAINTGLMALLGGDMSNPITGQAFGLANLAGQGAVEDVMNVYSSGNALYSGAAADTAARAATEARNQSLMGYMTQLGNLSQGYQQTGSQNLGLFANMLGAYGAPEYYTPSYVTNPGYLSPIDYYAIQEGIDTRNFNTIMGGVSSGVNLLASILGAGGGGG